MILELKNSDVIKKQEFNLTDSLTGIYGFNNSGKTTVLKELDRVIDEENLKHIVGNGKYVKSLLIPTNRIVVRQAYTNNAIIKDLEEFLSYKKECYKEFDLHLKVIKDILLEKDFIRQYIGEALSEMFGEYEFDFNKRQSDGVENIINIYCNIIWLLTWDQNIDRFTYDTFKAYLHNEKAAKAVVMIDEIEAFLHVCVQSRMLQTLKRDFPGCFIVFTTHSPLLLSRYRQVRKFHLKNGVLNEINENLYYKDLDSIYEAYFDVDEFPDEARSIINKLGRYVMGAEIDKNDIINSLNILNTQYSNISDKYIGLVAKAENRLGE